MDRLNHDAHDPNLDLVLDRIIDVPRELVWKGWTLPEYVKKWFAPAPWTITECEIELRPGGMFRTVLRSPEGNEFPSVGCFLEIIENEKLVFTDALAPGYRPSDQPFFTAVVTLEAHPEGTRYIARAMHKDEAGRKSHEAMGFHSGWSQVLDQLVDFVKGL